MSRESRLLLVGVWANRNWVLGNLVLETKLRLKKISKIWWIFSVFAGKSKLEKFFHFPLPRAGSYFFSYLSIFESYLKRNPNKYKNRSIVFYPHNEPEIGSLQHQVEVLNSSFAVYFMCAKNANELIASGLDSKKVRMAYFAIDIDCIKMHEVKSDKRTVVLASRFGTRKGLEILPELVREMPECNFIAIGRGWERFIKESGLDLEENFAYTKFDKESRSRIMSKAQVFLSLSKLEGGPVPLIEAMYMDVTPVATDTGFAKDFISDRVNGILLPLNPTLEIVKQGIIDAATILERPSKAVSFLTWDRLVKMILEDHFKIINTKK